jgi:hypothetical protein
MESWLATTNSFSMLGKKERKKERKKGDPIRALYTAF